jgi:dual specificity protein kinase YAK1
MESIKPKVAEPIIVAKEETIYDTSDTSEEEYKEQIINGYKKLYFMGKGSFSSVFKCNKNGEEYALKQMNNDKKIIKYATREINFLKDMKNPNIVKMVDNFIYEDIQYIVFEKLRVNLYSYNKHIKDFNILTKYCYQIADGLSYLHSKNIIHADLKLENIMLTNDLENIKIIDLGSSIESSYKIENKKNFYIQSRYYRAPEILYEIELNPKIDIWSYGVIITELVFKKCIFNGKDAKDMIYKICDYIDIPYLLMYTDTSCFNSLFIKDIDGIGIGISDYRYSKESNNYKLKGFRENRLDDYLNYALKQNFQNIFDYQIYNTISLIYKIFDYDPNTRLSAEECKIELSLLE